MAGKKQKPTKNQKLDPETEDLIKEVREQAQQEQSDHASGQEEPAADRQILGYHQRSIRDQLREQFEEIQELRKRVRQYESGEAVPVVLLDPWMIGISEVPNRTPASLKDEAYQALVESIAMSGVNHQPIKVRPRQEGEQTDRASRGQDVEHVLVVGERRLRACRSQCIRIRALVDSDLDAKTAIVEQVVGNEQRTSLSAYEQARQWQYAMDQGAFRSLRDFASYTGHSISTFRERHRILSLPKKFFDLVGDPSYLSKAEYRRLLHFYVEHEEHFKEEVHQLLEEVGEAKTEKMAQYRVSWLIKAIERGTMENDFQVFHVNGEVAYRQKMLCDGAMVLEIPKKIAKRSSERIEEEIRRILRERDRGENS
ncbi:ParB/RepB/Spo0J family partition protein [Halorhodospira sp. 9621]|uniref:ParB/RepB/Spo0J family partition protein n=1 Tax=Halorhodospira sp. 9621 TaxID=2899135 RepID=UPI001EE7B0D7|nr:ParB/RepB/Spo0J family partition protein [Halorhodospira sp. 9621]MCG5534289.1 ParB/RepB/Spo0J family partition protein [Halorhodospira sp. 9621]